MAIYHLHCQIIGRSSRRSAIAAIAYRAGEKLTDQETGIVSDYTRKGGVVYSEIQLCENAPAEYADRSTLWNAVEAIEKTKDAQLAREIEVALPRELEEQEWRQMIRNYCQDNFVSKGMIADWSIHHPDKANDNPHCHIMLTTRGIKDDGSWDVKEKKVYAIDANGDRIPVIDPKTGEQKIGARGRKMWERETVQTNDWNNKDNILKWREAWAEECNRWIDAYNEKNAQNIEHIDHRSYADQGVDRIPGIHVGVASREMATRQMARGEEITADRFNIHNEISEVNQERRGIQIEQQSILQQISDAIAEATQRAQEAQETLLQKIRTKVEEAKQTIDSLVDRIKEHFTIKKAQTDYDTLKQMYQESYDKLQAVDHMRDQIDRYRRLTDQVKEAKADIADRERSNADHPVSGIMLPKTRKENEQIQKENDWWIRKDTKDIHQWNDFRKELANSIRHEYAKHSGQDASDLKLKDIQEALKTEREDLKGSLRCCREDMDSMLARNPSLDKDSAQYRNYIQEQNRQAVYQWREELHEAAQHLDTPEGLDRAQRLIEDLPNHRVGDATKETCHDIEQIGQELLDRDRLSGIDWIDYVRPYSDRLEDLSETQVHTLHM